jgi:hypothetical protein
MADPDPPAEDPDDWFAGSDDDLAADHPALQTREATLEATAGADDWLEVERTGRPSRPVARKPNLSLAKVAVAVLVVVALIVGGLAVGGVFSSGGRQPTTTLSNQAGTTTTSSTSTTTTTSNTPVAAIPAAPTVAMKRGDAGAQVKVLQRALARLGYRVGPVDGSYGALTEAAVSSFQTAKKLTVDGIVGPETLKGLRQALAALR